MLDAEVLPFYELEISLKVTKLWKCMTESEINIAFLKHQPSLCFRLGHCNDLLSLQRKSCGFSIRFCRGNLLFIYFSPAISPTLTERVTSHDLQPMQQ